MLEGTFAFEDLVLIVCEDSLALQHLDVSYNRIENIDPISELALLEHLDVSGNNISSIFFVVGPAPKSLQTLLYQDNLFDDAIV